MFAGYAKNSKGYKFYNLLSGKTIISRDVEFNGEDYWQRNALQD